MYIVELQYPGTWLQLADDDKGWEIFGLIMSMETQLTDMVLTLSFFEEEIRKAASNFVSKDIRQQREQDQALWAKIENQYREELGVEAFNKEYASRIMKIEIEMKRKKWQDGSLPQSYKFRLPFIHAHSFLYALDSFGKFLDVIADIIANEDGLPKVVCSIRDGFYTALPSLRKIRNSAQHIENRIRGFGTSGQTKKNEKMKLKPINNRMINAPGGALVLSCLNGNRLGYTIDDGSYQEIEISPITLNVAHEALQKLVNSFAWDGPPRFRPD
jgi:hypothetical protein